MSDQLVLVDQRVDYQVKEAAIIVAALVWVLALGSVVLAALILCGWKGAKQVAFDWLHMKATFYCR